MGINNYFCNKTMLTLIEIENLRLKTIRNLSIKIFNGKFSYLIISKNSIFLKCFPDK